MLWHKISFIFIFLSCHFEPFLWSLKKLQIKQDFFKNLGVLKKKLVQNNLELIFFFDFCFLPTWFRAGKAKYLLNLAREFCGNCVEQNFRENPRSAWVLGVDQQAETQLRADTEKKNSVEMSAAVSVTEFMSEKINFIHYSIILSNFLSEFDSE